MHFKYKKSFSKKDLKEKLESFKEWQEVMRNASKYFGFVAVPDKKKKQEKMEHDLYSRKDLSKIMQKRLVQDEVIAPGRILELISQKVEKKNSLKAQSLKDLVVSDSKEKRVEKVPKRQSKKLSTNESEKILKRATCKVVSNYFQSYNGMKFLQKQSHPQALEQISDEDQKIINDLIFRGTQEIKEEPKCLGFTEYFQEEQVKIPEELVQKRQKKTAPSFQTQLEINIK